MLYFPDRRVATPSQCYIPDRRVGTLYNRLTRIKSVIYSRSPGRDPVLKGDRLTHVLYSRSPGWDPVLKVYRLTPVKKKGTLFYGFTRIKSRKEKKVDPDEGQVDP